MSSCAQKKVFIKSDPIEEDKKNSVHLLKSKKEIIAGPTQNSLTNDFQDQTTKYGLDDIKASNLYAIDFNNDGFSDLVVLPDHYSIPSFYAFQIHSSRFEKLSYNPLPEVIRGSYLSFLDFNKD